ncbi:MAG: tRNA (adenosine(37)-N6)-threonylcarbamoyltransferase complex dimerization subunit type 1 TsaB [Patescibacteria group bacterium]|nr:tRNA (adenosine(37)-N6)-threonylcarbamoyltransferase complex dimerization subunit type 1 TsaB [Patescibacteria group bacterium]
MILLINTATYISFVGIAHEKKIIKKKIWEANLRQSEDLLPIIKKLVGNNKIDGIIVVTGPGSYTGLRVGIATANALAFGWNCKVVGVDRFETMERQSIGESERQTARIEEHDMVIILENISDLIYFETKNNKLEDRGVLNLDDLCKKINTPCHFIGQIDSEKEKIIREKLKDKVLDIKIKDDFDNDVLENLFKIGNERLNNEEQNNIVVPYYLREPHITKPKK